MSQKYPEEYLCSICHSVFWDATQVNPCGHVFCESCLIPHFNYYNFCPVCHIKAHEDFPWIRVPFIDRLVGKYIGTPCEFCGLKGTMNEMRMHVCPNERIICRWRPCTQLIQRNMLPAHEKVCEHRQVRCEGCDCSIRAKFLDLHQQADCDRRFVTCDYCKNIFFFNEFHCHNCIGEN